MKKRRIQHRLSHTAEYRTWSNVIQRCTNPNTAFYAIYGGRGIGICERWRSNFEAFLADMGTKPSPNHQIDRINNDGNYEPGNCRWATPREQARNTRRNKHVEIDGVRMPVVDARNAAGLKRGTFERRLALGWSIEDVVSKPLRPNRRLTAGQRSEIATRFRRGERMPSIAAQMAVPYSTVYRVVWQEVLS